MGSSTTARNQPRQSDQIIIIGAGVFGLSLAYELSQRGYAHVTIVDRYLVPVPDGSSVDISRIIRPDYADDFYTKLGLEAMEGWQNEFKKFFYKSGLLCVTQDEFHPYLESSRKNLERLGKEVHPLVGNEAKKRYPGIHGDLSRVKGYANTSCGWADAEGSIRYLAHKCSAVGISFIFGSRGTVTSLFHDGHRVTGILTKANTVLNADYVVLASGAWTPLIMDMQDVSVSDSQPVGFLQLTPEEAKEMEDLPVMIDLSTGWFAFPPTPGTHILKMARHGYGFEVLQNRNQNKNVSAPDLHKDNSRSTFIPEEADHALREGLALFFPKLKDRKFMRRRLCWYTDTPEGNFIVDHHSEYSNVFMATGGSGQ